MQNYTKQCALPVDLILLLKERGLKIDNEQQAISYLTNIGYFRLSAYFHPLLKEPKEAHIYKSDATFEKAMNMYRFDRKLRLLLFNEIEKIEVAIRSRMVNLACIHTKTVFWVTDPQYFRDQNFYEKTLIHIDTELNRTKEDFILHFRSKYADPYPPSWMIVEILPLGDLCHVYKNLASKSLKKQIASYFGLAAPSFDSWVQILSNIRNLCGHHSRVWNREYALKPADLENIVYPWIDTSQIDFKRLYYRICMVKYFLFTVSPYNSFTQKITDLLSSFPTVDPRAMGFPENWKQEPLWNS